MIIKDASSCYDKAVQRTDRGRSHRGDHTVIVIDDSDSNDNVDEPTDLKSKGKVKKKKRLVKEKSSVHTDSKKKGKAKLKTKANAAAKHLTVSAHLRDSESLKDTGNIVKSSKRKKDQRCACEQDGRCESPKQQLSRMQLQVHFVISKKGKRKIMDCQGNDRDDHNIAKRKRKKQHKPTGDSEDEDGRPVPPNLTEVSQETVFLDQEKFGTTVHKPDAGFARKGKQFSKIREKGPFCPPQVDQNQKSPCTCEGLDDTDCVPEGESRTFKQKMKKKKKRKREKVPVPIITVDSQESYPCVSGKDLLKSKSKKKKGKSKLCLTDAEKDKKVKRKEKIRAKLVSKESSVSENGQGLPAGKQELATHEGKITGKKSKDKENSGKGRISRSEKSSEKHSKKRKRREDKEQEIAPKKVKIKKESKEGDDEIKVVAMKKGNCDEINIDKMRRQALQDEIDRESGKTKAFKQETETETQFGQWTTATFETSEQKTKFLRLLGGFKKAPASPHDSPLPAGKLNMAMDRSKEQRLQHSLQAEFEKAMDWKQHRRVGLGFQPATQKQGHIDKFASKSKKFGD